MQKSRVRYIFTYGTLMSCCEGQQGAAEREQMKACARLIGSAAVRGRVFDAGACPAAVLAGASAGERVRGEIWELPRDHAGLLGVLDDYEGCGEGSPRPFPYCRRRIRLRTPEGKRVTAWMYLWMRPTRQLAVVASGAWREPANAPRLAACAIDAGAFVKRVPVPA